MRRSSVFLGSATLLLNLACSERRPETGTLKHTNSASVQALSFPSAPSISSQPAPPSASLTSACNPTGPIPDSYSAPAVRAEGSLSLTKGWRFRLGDFKAASDPSFDDSAWEEIPSLSVRKLSSNAKQIVLWLRTSFEVPAGVDPSRLALDLGARTGHSVVWLNGQKVGQSPMRNGPVFLPAPQPLHPGRNVLAIRLTFGNHVGAIRWSGGASAGEATARQRGMLTRSFKSAVDASSQTLGVFLPRCADLSQPRPLVVALPGWDGNIYGFTHSRLLEEADKRGWIVVVPDPRGNVLYTGAAEQGVLEALDLVSKDLRVDQDRVYLTGVSMGGAGALQIGYHYPDRFAAITAFYGDSRYEPSGYVKPILSDQKTADRYSVLLFPLNARNIPVLLVHAKDDKVSAFGQSQQLAAADRALGLTTHRLLAPDTGGHSLAVVEEAVEPMVELFEASRRPAAPSRVSFKTSSKAYSKAYYVRTALRREGDFGEIDVSVDPKARQLHLHALSANLQHATIDLVAAGLSLPLSLIVDKSVQGTLVLTGLTQSSQARLQGKDLQQVFSIDQGELKLAGLKAGEWKLEAEPRADAGRE